MAGFGVSGYSRPCRNRGACAVKLFVKVFFVLLAVSACTPRGVLTMSPDTDTSQEVRQIFIGTTRNFVPEQGIFGTSRALAESYARYDVVIPPQRQPGSITWPRGGERPDPDRHFLTLGGVVYPDAAGFRQDMARALQRSVTGGRQSREAVIYIHGFNNNFAEGVYRIAQLTHDLDVPGVPVHYSWPSAANPLGYARDRDSVLYARDGLVRLMHETVAAGADRLVIVAHSMGALLAMEALRQVAISADGRALLDKVGGVVLFSPDIDVEVFRSQARSIGRLPQPFLIFTSRRDRLLLLSAGITGQRDRLGNVRNIAELADLEVTILEVGAFSTGAGHFTPGTSPALLQLMARVGELDAAFDRDQIGRVGLFPATVLTVQSATQIILLPVSAIAEIGQQ
jgi:esterase/lipase superfamily enzyme